MGGASPPGAAAAAAPAPPGWGAPDGARPWTPGQMDPQAQAAIASSMQVRNREDDELARALAASMAGEGGAPAAAPPAAAPPAGDPMDEDLAAALAASMGEDPPAPSAAATGAQAEAAQWAGPEAAADAAEWAAREYAARGGDGLPRQEAERPSAMDSFASIAGLPAAAALQGDAAAAGGLDARALAATMGLTVDPGGALSGLPAAVGRSAGGAGLSPTAAGMDDAAAQAAIMGSLNVQNREEDELSRAMAASLADGDTPPDSAAEPPAPAAPAVDPIGALTESVASALAAAGPPRPARQRRAHGASQADADEADDLAQAMAMSMGQPIDRGRRPAGAAAPETPPSVRRFRGSEHSSLRNPFESSLR